MQIKSIIAGAAIALAATVGAASAAEQFTTLDGVTAVAMSSSELATVTGMHKHFSVSPPGTEKLNGKVFLASFAGTGLDPAGPAAAGNGGSICDGAGFCVGSGRGLFQASLVTNVISVLLPGTGHGTLTPP